MAPSSTLISKLKVQLKLAISRLRMVQQKDTALAKQSRRSMAQLLEQGKIESARIRIENIIRSDLTTELHEILELYCELLLARSQLLDPALSSSSSSTDPEPTLHEPISSLIHAAPRTSIRELHTVRTLLIERYGKDLAVQAMEGRGVAPRVLSKLRTEAPRTELVDAYMREIARTYGVRIPGDEEDEDGDGDEAGDGDGQDIEAGHGAADNDNDNDNDNDDDDDAPSSGAQKVALPSDLAAATPPRAFDGPASPLRIAPPSPSSENVAPRVKGVPAPHPKPGPRMKKVQEEREGGRERGAGEGPGGKVPDVDELAKRFAALKR